MASSLPFSLTSAVHGLRVSEAINRKRRDFSKAGSTTFLTVQRLNGSKKMLPAASLCRETQRYSSRKKFVPYLEGGSMPAKYG
jgi:hypothetical protein